MAQASSWVPNGVNVDLPSAARVYDYLLGGGHNFPGNVHEVAQQAHPDSRVVYVDYEPVAVAHSELILQGDDRAAVIQADMRKPGAILNAPQTRRLIDLAEPLGLLMVGVVQFIPDGDDPWALAARYRDAIAPGSLFARSAFTWDNAPAGMAGAVEMFKSSQDPIHPRTREEIVRMFDGYELVDPGVVYTPQWRPERPDDVGDSAERSNLYAGVGYKP